MIKDFNPDVIRSYSPQIDGYLATYAGKKNHIPVIISLHGDKDRGNRYNMIVEKQYFVYLISLLHKYLFEIPSLKSCNHIIAVYEFAVEYGKKYAKCPITLIYNRVDTEIFYPLKNKKESECFTVMNIGRYIPGKNQEILIRAMQYINGKLILIGDGPLYKQLKHFASDLKVSNKIEMLKSVPNTELGEYYRRADVYATGIQFGGIAIPVLEAMASGLPIVQCPYPFKDKPEFIEDAGLIVECTPESFAKGINELKDNPELRERKAKFARQKMLKYNSKKMDDLEVEVYRDLIKKQ